MEKSEHSCLGGCNSASSLWLRVGTLWLLQAEIWSKITMSSSLCDRSIADILISVMWVSMKQAVGPQVTPPRRLLFHSDPLGWGLRVRAGVEAGVGGGSTLSDNPNPS